MAEYELLSKATVWESDRVQRSAQNLSSFFSNGSRYFRFGKKISLGDFLKSQRFNAERELARTIQSLITIRSATPCDTELKALMNASCNLINAPLIVNKSLAQTLQRYVVMIGQETVDVFIAGAPNPPFVQIEGETYQRLGSYKHKGNIVSRDTFFKTFILGGIPDQRKKVEAAVNSAIAQEPTLKQLGRDNIDTLANHGIRLKMLGNQVYAIDQYTNIVRHYCGESYLKIPSFIVAIPLSFGKRNDLHFGAPLVTFMPSIDSVAFDNLTMPCLGAEAGLTLVSSFDLAIQTFNLWDTAKQEIEHGGEGPMQANVILKCFSDNTVGVKSRLLKSRGNVEFSFIRDEVRNKMEVANVVAPQIILVNEKDDLVKNGWLLYDRVV